MPSFREADWYETPHYYDILLAPDSEREADFLEAILARHGASKRRAVLEPACGSGRLLVEMARRGYQVTGVDLSDEMVAFARRALVDEDLPGRVLRAPMQSFDLPGRFDLAHCLINTFKHLLSEDEALGALQSVARALRDGGIFVLGLHLTDYAWRSRQRERWVARRGSTRVVCNLQSWPADRRRRRERVRSRLTIEERDRVERMETYWEFRTYDEDELARLLTAVPQLEHVATYGFTYDLEIEPGEDDLDRVIVMRRRPRRRSRLHAPAAQDQKRGPRR